MNDGNVTAATTATTTTTATTIASSLDTPSVMTSAMTNALVHEMIPPMIAEEDETAAMRMIQPNTTTTNDTGGGGMYRKPAAITTTSAAGSSGGGTLDAAEDPSMTPDDDRQHWMPDHYAKQCYACDTQFTVFRRRHHCRICGQVFCNVCSGYFVPATTSKQGGAALQQPLQQPNIQSSTPMPSTPIAPATGAPAITTTATTTTTTATTTSSSSKNLLRTCKMCHDQVTAKQLAQKRVIQQQLEKVPRGQQRAPQTQQSKMKTPQRPSLQAQLETGDSVLKDLSKKRTESAYAKRRLLSQQKAMEEEEKEQTSLILQEQQEKEDRQLYREKASSRGVFLSLSPRHEERKNAAGFGDAMPAEGDDSSDNDDRQTAVLEGKRHLGLSAAAHLEQMAETLLASDAPLLWNRLTQESRNSGDTNVHKRWINKLMHLATKCCTTVQPNVKKGDLLDIRPYVKTKVIPGGSYKDCAYISGIMFRKTVSHKQMARDVNQPRIMLLSGGIEFTRTENRIASLDSLLVGENKYMEILVGKILKLKPDVLLVGKAVSRRAQELLLKARVVLVQHVKASLLERISRQTGATIISSTDHIMNKFGAHVLGKCHRFRTVVARDNEVWVDKLEINYGTKGEKREVQNLLMNPNLPNHKRQEALAANMLGENVTDGSEAIRSGLAKRGVAQTYIMMEGCPKHLGCTVVLRGADREALKQVKKVFRLLVNAAYNLHLETTFLKERCACLRHNYSVQSENLCSSSLCVDYGSPPNPRKARPWNGGANNEGAQRSISGGISVFDHQSILVSSVWMTSKTQCCPAEVKGICYYSMQDVSLGQFLRDSCFNLSLKCQNSNCKKSVLDHSLSFVHNDGFINITVDYMDEPLPPAPLDSSRKRNETSRQDVNSEDDEDSPIATWTYCKSCGEVVTPLVYISDKTWNYSFGKFLESFFYNRNTIMNSKQHKCSCSVQTETNLFFGCGRLAARFTYERLKPFNVFVRKSLPLDVSYHRVDALRQLDLISKASSSLFVNFDEHISKVSREAMALFGNSTSRPELDTVLSELQKIASEVDNAAKTLQEKIASVSDKCTNDEEEVISDALFRFPWFARRYLYMLTSAWNEKLSAAGQAIVAMKKISSSASNRNDSMSSNVPLGASDQNDELHEGMRRLRQLREVYSRYNITDITTVIPTIPGTGNQKAQIEYDDDFDDHDAAVTDFNETVDSDVLASRRRLQTEEKSKPKGSTETIPNTTVTAKVTPGGAVKSAITRFFNRGGHESDPYIVDLGIFNEGRPRLEPGVNGIIIPVVDEQFSTAIAYSLSSTEYARQFDEFSKEEPTTSEPGTTSGVSTEHGALSTGQQDLPPTGRNAFKDSKTPSGSSSVRDKEGIERRILVRNKSHVKHTFRDFDEKGNNLCKFVVTTYWATQFHAVREAFLTPSGSKNDSFVYPPGMNVEQGYVQSLTASYSWAASGGKSGASFARTADDRFVIKHISKTELQMFLECAPAYFEYLSKVFFHGLPTVLCKVVGVYTISFHNRVTGKRSMEQVAVMQNIFCKKKITKTFDLKGSLRGRFAALIQNQKYSSNAGSSRVSDAGSSKGTGEKGSENEVNDGTNGGEDTEMPVRSGRTLLDGDFLEFTAGRPMPMNDRAKAVFHMSILNDTLFLSIINVLDYSILVGIDEENNELVVGIIDFMRQYDILKQMERVGKSLPMVVGSEAPTIIQPPLYKARFTNAMERYFMTVPSKWTTI
ncbi:MAG: hypothetical protein SGBAC_005933 [Bacillariaceae sp.]